MFHNDGRPFFHAAETIVRNRGGSGSRLLVGRDRERALIIETAI